ncbi:hypothetical protein [Pelagibius marinus]|uniref:hypothetical protein n=1 Tax=Pelagibius marinus TaxID=2762760 RepID=UPI001872B010|nr:hypothetical protein [Pelagibius marinus]
MPLEPEDRRWLMDWARKVGITAYLLFVLAFMAGHPAPGSVASLSYAVMMAIIPAAIGTAAVLGLMLYLRKR